MNPLKRPLLNKLLLVLVWWLGLLVPLFSQGPYLHFYQQNWTWVNPAAMDRSYMRYNAREPRPHIFHFDTRLQWLGMEGAPKTFHLGFEHNPMVTPNGEGLRTKFGVGLFGHTIGNFKNYGIYGNFGYSLISGSRGTRLFLGINAGIVLSSFGELHEVRAQDQQDELLNEVVGSNVSYADFGFGIFYKKEDDFYIGASLPRLVSPLNVRLKQDGPVEHLVPKSELITPVYLVAGMFLENDFDLTIEPSIWVRYTWDKQLYTFGEKRLPLGVDANVRVYLPEEKFWLGIGYGTNRHFAFDIGAEVAIDNRGNDKIRISIGNMLPLFSNGLNFGSSLEISVAYMMGL